jgi:two-component system, cell cycle response regulator DivK
MLVVLIVDDNERNRKLARDVLGAAGFEILEASTGAEGIAIAIERLPNVILLDLRLPDMSGIEVARALGVTGSTCQIPIVATSALSLEEAGGWLEEAGFAGWIEKPISVASFAEQVRRHCGTEG